MLLTCKEINRDLVRESFTVDIRTPTCVHSPRRQRIFLLSLFCISDTVVLHFIFAVCVMKCKHFSRDRKAGCHGITSLFKTNFYTLPKYQRTKPTCFYTLDPSMLQSIPCYFYLVMQGNTCLSSSSLACGWNIFQHITASTSRNSFKLILRESLLCLLFPRGGSATNWQGILKGWNNECFLSLRNNYWMLWVRLTNT